LLDPSKTCDQELAQQLTNWSYQARRTPARGIQRLRSTPPSVGQFNRVPKNAYWQPPAHFLSIGIAAAGGFGQSAGGPDDVAKQSSAEIVERTSQKSSPTKSQAHSWRDHEGIVIVAARSSGLKVQNRKRRVIASGTR
jgi:hypothetical protein